MNKKALGFLCGLTAASIWGAMYVVSKAVLAVIPPFSLLALRLILGTVTLGVVMLFMRRSRLTSRQIRNSFLVGIVGYGVSLGFQFVGTNLSTASNGALVTSATPAFVLLFAPYLLGEKASWRGIFALGVSTVGVVIVIDPRTADLSSSLFLGNLSLLAAALTWALYSVLVRKVARSVDLIAASAVMLAGGIPSSILVGFHEIENLGIGEITMGIIGGILFLGVISTALAMFLWNYAFAQLPAATASFTFFAQPVVGAFLGWFFLGEKITLLFVLGGILIGVGMILSSMGKS
jgi:drug/metabolite transporter (DMT)-like permease